LARATALLAVLVGFVAAAVYANTLGYGFVYDDWSQVLGNRWISSLGNLPHVFASGVWEFEGGVSNYYRPVMHLAYMLTYKVSGLDPWAYHAANVLLHATVSVLVFWLALDVVRRAGAPGIDARWAALAAGLAYATHPVLSEAVAWVACVPELTFTAMALASLLLYARSDRMWSASYLASVAVFFMALLSKETAITVPVLLVAWDLSFRRPLPRSLVAAARYLPFALAGAAYVAIRFTAMPSLAPVRRHATMTTSQYLINALPLFAKYLGKLLWPIQLSAYHPLHPILTLASPSGLVSLGVTLAFIGATILAFLRFRPAFFALAVVAVPLLPVLYVPLLGENTFTERYLYLPAVGLALLLALAISAMVARRPGLRLAAGALVGLVVAGAAVTTVRRSQVWKDDESLWKDAVAQYPDSGAARGELGIAYMDRGLDALAGEQFREAVRLDPTLPRVHNNLGMLLERGGNFDEAMRHFQRAIELNPRLKKAYANRANALARRGFTELAVRDLLAALALDPEMTEARLNLGNLYSQLGRRTEAMEQFRIAMRTRPDSAEVYLQIGTACGEWGDLPCAVENLQLAKGMSPRDPIIRRNLAQAYRMAGRRLEAEQELRRASELER
jgi:tetratricopeptide (TPR) repeat protein